MDQATFLTDLFADYDTDSAPSETIQARAVRKAQNAVGCLITEIDADSEERDWLENRVERFAIDSLLVKKAEDFNYNKAQLAQVFENFKALRINLEEDWKEIRAKIKGKKGIGGFQVVSPGYAYDDFGRIE